MACCNCCCTAVNGECCGPPGSKVCCKEPRVCCGQGVNQTCCQQGEYCCKELLCCEQGQDCCGTIEEPECCPVEKECCFSLICCLPGKCCGTEEDPVCCGDGECCVDGACEPCEECMEDADCPEGERCCNGFCEPIPPIEEWVERCADTDSTCDFNDCVSPDLPTGPCCPAAECPSCADGVTLPCVPFGLYPPPCDEPP